MSEAARRAGRIAGRRARARLRGVSPYEDEWPELRRAILAQGGIGHSRDWDNDSWPGDLYRAGGKAPDLVAEETTIGYADRPAWGEGGDSAMHRYLERAHYRHEQVIGREKRGPAEELPEDERPRAPRRSHEGRRELESREARLHGERMGAFIREARARRRAQFKRPAIGFYTDEEDRVRPITAARNAGKVYAARRAGRPRA